MLSHMNQYKKQVSTLNFVNGDNLQHTNNFTTSFTLMNFKCLGGLIHVTHKAMPADDRLHTEPSSNHKATLTGQRFCEFLTSTDVACPGENGLVLRSVFLSAWDLSLIHI